MDKIHAPTLIGGGRLRGRATMQTQALALTDPHPHLQTFQPIEPMYALVIDRPAFSAQQDVDAQIAEVGAGGQPSRTSAITVEGCSRSVCDSRLPTEAV